MELFLPSILVIIFAALVIMIIIPNFSPLIIVILSAILLTASTYQHFTFFWSEYQQSTWQTNLKIFAPGIIITGIFIYIFVVGGSFLFSGQMPEMPAMELPPASTATNSVTSAINNSMSAISNATSSVSNSIANSGSAVANSLGLNGSNNARKNNKNNGSSLFGASNSNSANKGPTTSALAII
jgi:hypothetical protein